MTVTMYLPSLRLCVLFVLISFSSTSSAHEAPSCQIDPIVVQSVFAIDVVYENSSDVILNRQIFMADVRSFLATLQSQYGVTDVNAVFAFGDSFKLLQNFTIDSSGQLDFGGMKTKVGKKTVEDALEEILSLFEGVEAPTTADYVRLGIVITDRSADDVERLQDLLRRRDEAKIIMYAVGGEPVVESLKRIADDDERTFVVDMEDVKIVEGIKEKFRHALCKGIEENRIFRMLTIGAGSIVGIVVGVVIALVVVYVAKEYTYKKWQLRQLAAAEAALKKSGDDTNPMYKDPVTKTSPEELGVNMNNI